jgi:hypothetical protein
MDGHRAEHHVAAGKDLAAQGAQTLRRIGIDDPRRVRWPAGSPPRAAAASISRHVRIQGDLEAGAVEGAHDRIQGEAQNGERPEDLIQRRARPTPA